MPSVRRTEDARNTPGAARRLTGPVSRSAWTPPTARSARRRRPEMAAAAAAALQRGRPGLRAGASGARPGAAPPGPRGSPGRRAPREALGHAERVFRLRHVGRVALLPSRRTGRLLLGSRELSRRQLRARRLCGASSPLRCPRCRPPPAPGHRTRSPRPRPLRSALRGLQTPSLNPKPQVPHRVPPPRQPGW